MNPEDSTPAETAPAKSAGAPLDPEEEKARYEEAWRTLGQHSRRFWIGVALFPPVVLLVSAILGRFIYGLLAFAVAVTVYFAIRWALKFDRGPSVHDFLCPRCGKEFFRNEKRTDTLSRKCMSCELSRGALPPYFDPPVKPKSNKK